MEKGMLTLAKAGRQSKEEALPARSQQQDIMMPWEQWCWVKQHDFLHHPLSSQDPDFTCLWLHEVRISFSSLWS